MQPSPRSCGQTCLAVLTGMTPQQWIELVPDRRGTTGIQLVEAAQSVIHLSWPPRRYEGQLPPDARLVARVRWGEGRSRTHWIVVDTRPPQRTVYDPGLITPKIGPVYDEYLAELGGRIVSYMGVVESLPAELPPLDHRSVHWRQGQSLADSQRGHSAQGR